MLPPTSSSEFFLVFGFCALPSVNVDHWKAVVLPDAAYYVLLDLSASWTCSEAPWEADDITMAY